MARWHGRAAPRVEPPEWYRVYHPEQWGEPDAQEQAMMAGSDRWGPWPDELRDYHARRRWEEAKYAYRREHPLLAEQEFAELFARVSKRRDSAS
jgi:hypothetical protein